MIGFNLPIVVVSVFGFYAIIDLQLRAMNDDKTYAKEMLARANDQAAKKAMRKKK